MRMVDGTRIAWNGEQRLLWRLLASEKIVCLRCQQPLYQADQRYSMTHINGRPITHNHPLPINNCLLLGRWILVSGWFRFSREQQLKVYPSFFPSPVRTIMSCHCISNMLIYVGCFIFSTHSMAWGNFYCTDATVVRSKLWNIALKLSKTNSEDLHFYDLFVFSTSCSTWICQL